MKNVTILDQGFIPELGEYAPIGDIIVTDRLFEELSANYTTIFNGDEEPSPFNRAYDLVPGYRSSLYSTNTKIVRYENNDHKLPEPKEQIVQPVAIEEYVAEVEPAPTPVVIPTVEPTEVVKDELPEIKPETVDAPLPESRSSNLIVKPNTEKELPKINKTKVINSSKSDLMTILDMYGISYDYAATNDSLRNLIYKEILKIEE